MKLKCVGGRLTMWNDKMDQQITLLNNSTERCLLIKLRNHSKPTYLLNTYMPTYRAVDKYAKILNEVFEINQSHGMSGTLIWVGD